VSYTQPSALAATSASLLPKGLRVPCTLPSGVSRCGERSVCHVATWSQLFHRHAAPCSALGRSCEPATAAMKIVPSGATAMFGSAPAVAWSIGSRSQHTTSHATLNA
jgi:hypothetical protein